jgi:bacteriorhodopsin
MAPLVDGWDYGSWSAVYNALSFGIAGMGSATIFFWLQLPNVRKKYRTALIITGLVTCIATYHYFRIFNSWCEAFNVKFDGKESYTVELTGEPFNDAYRYVDWLLTVPLLLIELILVMGLPADQTYSMSWTLGLASALMVALGYPGEIQDKPSGRWTWWCFAMVPFCYVVYSLAVGLESATAKMHPDAASLTRYARWLTIISWLTYPGVYLIKMVGLAGVTATAAEQIGYSIADVVAKAVFGVLIWSIASTKSRIEDEGALLAGNA